MRLFLKYVIYLSFMLCFHVLIANIAVTASEEDKPYIGFYSDTITDIPEPFQQAYSIAIQVNFIVPYSSAHRAGIQTGDLIVQINGESFDETKLKEDGFRSYLYNYQVGETISLTIIRKRICYEDTLHHVDNQTIESLLPFSEENFYGNLPEIMANQPPGASISIEAYTELQQIMVPVLLSCRSMYEQSNRIIIPDEEAFPGAFWGDARFEDRILKTIETNEWNESFNDLQKRLKSVEVGDDGYRLPLIRFIHNNPLKTENLVDYLLTQFFPNTSLNQLEQDPLLTILEACKSQVFPNDELDLHETTAGLLDITQLKDLPSVIQFIKMIFGLSHEWLEVAFSHIDDDERELIATEMEGMLDFFAQDIYVHSNPDRNAWKQHYKIIQYGKRLDYMALYQAAALFSILRNPVFINHIVGVLFETYDEAERAQSILYEEDSPYGKFMIGGTARNWHRTNTAFLIDLGGDDFYTNNSGSSTDTIPASILIDVEGNDAYETTHPFSQGTGFLGLGYLVDQQGDDQYISIKCGQALSVMGVGVLEDNQGNDWYRGRYIHQAVGAWGAGILLDKSGNDHYESHIVSQGVGLPGGFGVLWDRMGNDSYYSKGREPTGYGTPGVFDGWSQGMGVGYREFASGGLGLLCDDQGEDRLEAGNFSQGGGYYFGTGILVNRGIQADQYIGSRYNQGFSAHQAVGIFIEEGGDDFYTTRNGVAQGLAWDQCVTLFLEKDGDDIYQGGSSFSQGASAHNSVTLFYDLDGADFYDYNTIQARAGGNNYHGGTSFSFFLDQGTQEDQYRSEMTNNSTRSHPEYGIAIDE